MVRKLDSIRELLAVLFIGGALCVVIYNEVKVIVPQSGGTQLYPFCANATARRDDDGARPHVA